MTPGSELDRLFGQVLQSIPKPDPLERREPQFYMVYREITMEEALELYPPIDPIDPIDADETNYGVCAQGESDEQ